MASENGETYFIRCADCEEMYVATEAFSFATGQAMVLWRRPRPKRKPVQCAHRGAIQRWDGHDWVAAEVTHHGQ